MRGLTPLAPVKTLRGIDAALCLAMWDQPDEFAVAGDEFLADPRRLTLRQGRRGV